MNERTHQQYLQDQIVILRGLIEDKVASATSAAERSIVLERVHPAMISLAKLQEKEIEFQLRVGETMTKNTWLDLWAAMSRLMVEELQVEFGEQSNRLVDRLAPKMADLIAAAKNN